MDRLNSKPLIERNSFILELSKGRNILHLGCCASPYCEERFNSGELLHLKLLNVANKCAGIDIDEKSIEFLINKGIDNIKVGDIELLSSDEFDSEYDLIVAGEILEHLNNLGLFLSAVTKIMKSETKLLITVPNTPSVKAFLRALAGREEVHPDHVCYFSANTIETLLKRFRLEVDSFYYYCAPPVSGSSKFMWLLNKLLKIFCLMFPCLADGFVVIAELRNDNL
jgi:cyclopropane fatty-acyl-phospholipid synthase-like methyltransferase